MNDMINRIDRAIEMSAAVVAGIPADRMTAPTPCVDWDVREVLNHLVGGMNIFAAQLRGVEPGREHHDDWLGAAPHAAYAAAAVVDMAAWHRSDALERTVRLGFGEVPGPMAAVIHLTEVLVHGIDLAVATGQESLLDQQLCAEMLAIMRNMGMDNFRGPGMFGPELPAVADAPAHRQLSAYLGRSF
ncbi:TIGR03086 family metal-binding protein [Nocardia sp. NBC_00565]|uniref:TIGR03086 family metal-binding protein n=1 Tax=Nocardia sp. NBC_00565 TaxID=2975993 RepID=UPI002E81CCE9|nr:TIGR03086 family metal-binding protein [Nocardia sp. NBC_00565]WUC03001.1 TIGR03086 family metal-binding protein [Nocardia sp. NBC_00565]